MLIGKYRLYRVIGDGSFSKVRLGYHIFTNERVAVKIIAKSVLNDKDGVSGLLNTVEIMKRLDHPGIAKMIEFLEDEQAYYIVLEYCGGGELFDFIIARKRVEEPLAKRLFKQIALTVQYFHSMNIIHRDLKPENILLTESNSLKIIDFGLCSATADAACTDRCGSSFYIAPEALITSSYFGIPADIWALGVIMYALVDGSLPWNYQDSNRMYEQITTGDFPMPKGISVQCQDLLKRILNPDPIKRINIEGILTHPWLFGTGNVFPVQKPVEQSNENRLTLSSGGFSAGDVQMQLGMSSNKPSLETIYEDSVPMPQPIPETTRKKRVQPRSISLNSASMTEHVDDGTNVHHGVIFSKTISHRDPETVATSFEDVLLSQGVSFTRMGPLLFNLVSGDVQVTAEVCKLYGFRNVYILSFSRLHGDSWSYTQFVSSLLNHIH